MQKARVITKILSAMLMIGVIASIVTVPGAVLAASVPACGIIWEADLDGTDKVLADFTGALQKITGNLVKTPDHGGAHEIILNGVSTGIEYYAGGDRTGASYINTGIIEWSQDVMIPAAFDFDGATTNNAHVNFITSFTTSWKYGYPYTLRVMKDADHGEILFNTTTLGSAPEINSGTTVKELDFGQWYNIAVRIDYNAGNIQYYVDGVLAGKLENQKEIVTTVPIGWMAFRSRTESGLTTATNPGMMLVDNYRFAFLDEASVFDATATKVTKNKIELKFNRAINPETVPASVAIYPTDGGDEIPVANLICKSGNTLVLTLEGELKTGKMYLIDMGEVTAAYGGDGSTDSIKGGITVVYSGEAGTTTQIPVSADLYVNNFDSLTSTQYASEDFFKIWYRDASASRPNYYYYNGWHDGFGTIKEDEDGQRLELYGDFNWGIESAALAFPFDNGQTANSGVVTIEFEAMLNDQEEKIQGLQFGLQNKDEAVAKNEASYGMALASLKVDLAVADKATLQVAGTEKAHNADQEPSKGAVSVDINTAYCYRIILDMDNDLYSVAYKAAESQEYTTVHEATELPAGVDGAEFDAFTVTINKENGSKAKAARIYLDDVTITHTGMKTVTTGEALHVTNMIVTDYKGDVTGYQREVTAGTKTIDLIFSEEMEASVSEHITVSNMTKNVDYTVGYSNKIATITFENCLTANTLYTITVLDTQNVTGTKSMGQSLSYQFASDEGSLVYMKPVIKINGVETDSFGTIEDGTLVTAELEILNTAKELGVVWMDLLGYKDEELVGVNVLKIINAASDEPIKHVSIEINGLTGNLTDVDELVVHVFDGLMNLEPLTDAAKIRKTE